MVQLLPVIENGYRELDVDWAPMTDTGGWIILSGETSDEDLGRAIANIASYSRQIGVRESLRATTEAIVETPSFVVGGGLLFRSGDLEVTPGCCCGLEGWREWYAVKKGGQSPWWGHDPTAWVDCSGELAVVWADEGHSRSVAVSYDEIATALDMAANDLSSFVERLREWVGRRNADSRLPSHFKRVFDV